MCEKTPYPFLIRLTDSLPVFPGPLWVSAHTDKGIWVGSRGDGEAAHRSRWLGRYQLPRPRGAAPSARAGPRTTATPAGQLCSAVSPGLPFLKPRLVFLAGIKPSPRNTRVYCSVCVSVVGQTLWAGARPVVCVCVVCVCVPGVCA